MCGILFYRTGRSDELARTERFEHALDLMNQRGPDGRCLQYGSNYVVGHTRLAIIDLSARAAQPFWDRSRRHVLTYNGELYNYRELRKELLVAGVQFESESDTEVVLYSLLHFGPDEALSKFRGMFAFVLYDTHAGTVVAARDHFGQKPLYYSRTGSDIIIASDVRSVLTLSGAKQPDLPSYEIYLSATGQTGTRGQYQVGKTFFEGCFSLPAGHLLEIQNDESVQVREYFGVEFLFDEEAYFLAREKDLEEHVRDVGFYFRQALRRHIVSDVDVGVLLSGGIDSSLVYWLASGESPKLLSSFTKISSGIETIPLEVVPKLIRKRPGHAHFIVQSPTSYFRQLTRFVEQTAAPSRWGGGPPMNNLCEVARRNGVHVLLGGDCVDEYFSGYAHYEELFSSNAGRHLDEFDELIAIDQDSPFLTAAVREEYMELEGTRRRRILWAIAAVEDEQERFVLATLLHDTATFLQTIVLPHSDAYSMMTSVEVRTPLLDLDLVKHVTNLPARYKTQRHGDHFGKCLLREFACREIGNFVDLKKEGTRNFAMHMSQARFWNFPAFSLNEVIAMPQEPSKRDIMRIVNLELFHRFHILGQRDTSPMVSEEGAAALLN